MSFWDDPDVRPAASEWFKFEAINDEIEGTISKLTKRTFGTGSDERLAVEITWAEDDVPAVTCGQVMLQKALYQLRPEPGDRLAIRLAKIEKRGTKTLKLFEVAISRADGTSDLVDQTA